MLCKKCGTQIDEDSVFCQKCGEKIESFCDCHQGYKGRIGIYQFLQRNQEGNFHTDYPSLYQAALNKVADQTTDLAEIQRVLGSES